MQEARDILVGKLFGLGALVRSGLLHPSKPKQTPIPPSSAAKGGSKGGKTSKAAAAEDSSSGSALNPEARALSHCCWAVRELLSLGSRKSFLREAATGAVLELLGSLGPEMVKKVRHQGGAGSAGSGGAGSAGSVIVADT